MPATAPVRVLLADDSAMRLTSVSDVIRSAPRLHLAALAARLDDIAMRLRQYSPDVLVMGTDNAAVDLAALISRARMAARIPVVFYSSHPDLRRRALLSGAAAVTYAERGDIGGHMKFVNDLTNKASHAQGTPAPVGANTASAMSSVAAINAARANILTLPPVTTNFSGIIALGASTGGTEATVKILKRLPANIPPIVIVQHMPPGFTKVYAERLDRECAFSVVEAQGDMPLKKGVAYLAPGGYQMQVVKGGLTPSVQVRHGEKVSGHCPSVDVLFDSVSMTMAGNAVGIILTGMGADGANGLLAMRRRGAFTIGQDEASCVVYGMPAVAYNIGAVMQQSSLDNIASVLVAYLNKR